MDSSSQPWGQQSAQGSASLGDVTTKLDGINLNLSANGKQLAALVTLLGSIFARAFGTFTLAAAASTVVTQTAIKANSVVLWTPTNAAAGTLEGGAKNLYLSALTAGASFTVATANGVAAAGSETFQYSVWSPS